MTVFAIDPGNVESAFVVWDGSKILDMGKVPNGDIGPKIREWDGCDTYSCEMIASYGMAVGKEVFETCVWIGRFIEIAAADMHLMELTYRRDVKLHICNSPKAKDANIIQALKDRFGDKGTKRNPGVFYGVSGDVWQAIALAVTVCDQGSA